MNNSKLVSYCLFTYNQEKYIKDAIEGALKQTYTPLEIIISDDFSTDSTFQIAKDTVMGYAGPHKIMLNRNESNIGLGGHFSKVCYSVANGEYLITAAGDDISKVDHVEKAVSLIERHQDVKIIDFSGEIIDETGNIIQIIELDFTHKKFTIDDYISLKKIKSFAPGRIFKRELLTSFNPIGSKCPTEDSVLVLRGLLTGGIIRFNIPLVFYRKHGDNLSSPKGLANLSNLAIISQYLDDVLHLFNNNTLNEYMCSFILKRINLEYKVRNLKYIKFTSPIKNTVRKVLIKLLTVLFKFQVKYKINNFLSRQ